MTPLTRHGLLLAVAVCGLVTAALTLDTTMTTAPARAADENQTRGADSEAELPSAPVVIDGTTLFRVRGTSVVPAEKRAAAIASRIRALAADRAVPVDAVRPVETEIGSAIMAGGHRVMTVFDADARYESLHRKVLTEALVASIRAAVSDYRQARSREALIRTAVYGALATAILAVLVALVVWLSRRGFKNEEVIIPNSSILTNEVVNYSSLAHRHGLILHTKVGIGYETPWRQVEAMLLIAAERTPRIMSDPKPFVRQLSLGDFAVTYEINVYCDNPQAMGQIYTALHRNILDVFNEHGIQIMTPAYEGDPESPKVVPKAQWFTAPAKPVAEPDTGNP